MCDIKRAFNMKFARNAGRVQPAIVIHAVGDIGVLLHFIEQHTSANGMHCSGWHKYHVTGRNSLVMEHLF